ncbi:MAG: glycosyltransferase family 4 protein, partial [Rhodobacteraceae bacterium]|nr:glycosyltransferase family 4 protein [Paracoccaceae bacterium]
ARLLEGTHIAIVGPSEVLTSNMLRIKDTILGSREGQMVHLPAFYCWKSLEYYRDDRSSWSNGGVPVGFKISSRLHWKGTMDTERVPRGEAWVRSNPIQNNVGGIMNLDQVNWKRAVSKYYLGEMKKILKRPSWKVKREPQASCPLDETGIKISSIHPSWWEGYKEFMGEFSTKGRSSYEEEISGLMLDYGSEHFQDIYMPGETIHMSMENLPPLVLNRNAINRVTPPKDEKKPVPKKAAPKKPASRYTVLWSGHFYDYSGYGKANREMLFRAANSLQINVPSGELNSELVLIDGHSKARIDAHRIVELNEGCPYLRFFGPRVETHRGYKICYTMMETYGVHPDLAKLLNGYDEVWVPTDWNKKIFEGGGVTSPVRAMPLGIDPNIFRPGKKTALPPATLLTTKNKGVQEVPEGFLFINASNPSFRKGIDVVIKAFEAAFSGDPEVALVLSVSYSSLVHCDPFHLIPGGKDACKSRIYVLEGKMTEEEMADMYRSCNVYVTASRGEGWNLPLMEAAACGLPVVAPDAFSHKEFLTEKNSFLFNPDGLHPIVDSEKISPWYQDQLFVYYGDPSIKQMSIQMDMAKKGTNLAKAKAELLRNLILEKYTWDKVASRLTSRLMEVCERVR